MIDLTPLDVRKKRGDFRKQLRGYDPEEVDSFLELVAERMEDLVREVLTLRERTETLSRQVEGQEGRERAVQQALVTAQELREDIREQAAREADLLRKEAEAEIDDRMREAQGKLDEARRALEALERKRTRFLKAFRGLLEQELDNLEIEEDREGEDDEPVELDLGEWRSKVRGRLEDRRRREVAEAETGSASADEEGRTRGTPAPPEDGRSAPSTPAGGAEDQAAPAAGASPADEDPDEPLWLTALLEEQEPRAGEGEGVPEEGK